MVYVCVCVYVHINISTTPCPIHPGRVLPLHQQRGRIARQVRPHGDEGGAEAAQHRGDGGVQRDAVAPGRSGDVRRT